MESTRNCEKCGRAFQIFKYSRKKAQDNRRRKNCYDCVPFGAGNSKPVAYHEARTRVCRVCLQEKEVGNFYPRGNQRSAGLPKRRTICNSCHTDAGNELRRTYKQAAVDLRGGKCERCGYSNSLAALEFHHVQPDLKAFSIGKSRRSPRGMKAELDKCVLICANCHREAHECHEQAPEGLGGSGVQCSRCGVSRNEEDFPLRQGKRHRWCRFCVNSYQRENRREIKQEIVDFKGGRCSRCGYNTCLEALELHHPDPGHKDLTVSALRKRLVKIQNEIEKCVLLCANCHRETHN